MDEFGLTTEDFVKGVDPTVENILDIIVYKERITAGATRLVLCPTAYTMLKEALGLHPLEDREIARHNGLRVSVEMEDELGEVIIDVC